MRIIENPNEALVSQNQTILMVDDTPTNLAVVGDYLTQQGYQVMVALTGETGVNVAKEAHPDLILLDVRLPGIDGFETCRRLKADEQTRDIPVIFMTIVTRTEDKVRGFEAGGVDYITKPFQHEDVLARVTTHLRIRELTQKLEEAKESLELRVVERTSELAQANIRLKEEIAERKKSEEALQRLNRELRAISNCNQVLMRSVDEQTLLNDICRIVCDEAGYHMAWVGYAENDEAKTVRPVAWAGNEAGYLASANITWADTDRGRGPSGTAIRHGESVCIQDFTTDPQVAPWRENALQRGYRSSIALPLKDESARTFGTLTIYSTEADAFTPDEIRLLEELAGDLAFGIGVLRARTARKQAETEIQALAKFPQENPNPVLRVSKEGVLLYANRASADLIQGWNCSVGGQLPEFWHRLILDVLDSGWPREEEIVCGEHVFTLMLAPFVESGYVNLYGRDITERKRTDAALKRSESFSRSIIENEPECVKIVGAEGILKYMNPAGLAMIEVEDLAVVAGHSVYPIVVPEHRQAFMDLTQKVLQGERGNLQFEIIGLKGTRRWLDTHAVPLFDDQGNVEALLGLTRDVTERKRVEDALVFVAQRGWQTGAENFFDALAQFLGEKLDMDYVLIDRIDENPDMAETVALYAKGAIAPNMRYALKGTPCENVMGRRLCVYPQGIQQLFPEDTLLLGMGAESFIGIPLWDSTGQPIGLIAVMDNKPIPDDAPVTQLLQLVATRAAAELERERSDRLLRAREHEFRTLAENSPDVIVRYDREGRRIYVNPEFERVNHLSAQEVQGKTPVELSTELTPKADVFTEKLMAAMVSGITDKIDLSWTKDGQPVCWFVRVVPEFDANDKVVGALAIWSDISERKQAEEDLRASESRFRTFVDHAADAFFVHEDEDGTILDVNRQTCESLGYRREELIGMTSPDFDLNASPEFLMQLRARLRAGEVVAFDTYHRRKDGTTFPVEVRIRPFWQGDKRLSVSLVRDISERQRAELEREQLLHQIRQQAKEVQFILDTVPEGMFLLSENGHVRLANAIAEQYLALLAPGWETDPLTCLGQYPLVDLLTSPPKGLWHDVVMGERLFEVIARPVENGPTNEGWVFVIRDVTREREIQQHLQAHERLAAVGQLAAGIAHDFNNTLAVIKLYTELLLRTLELPPRAEERLHILEQQTQQASDLIQQILDFSRQSVMERQPLNLLSFLKELIRLLRRTLPESIDIELDYAQDAYVIHADPSRIQQAIMNLALNARDAMAEGGHLLIGLNSIRLEPGALPPVPGMGPGEWIRVSIMDSGTGIPAEAVGHIFEPFFTTKKRGQGTGLGLAQVYGIVQQHDGFIGVTTEVGRGTTFQLYFPAFALDWQTIAKPPAAALPQGQRQVVLVVEDEDAMRQALVESLTLLNYSVREARNGREALSILAQHSHEIALVLSDAVMPEMGGVALFHALRKQGLAIPFVIVTGHAVEKDVENLRALGLYGWLRKPLELSKLAELLRQRLR